MRDFLDRLFRRSFADLRPRTGAKTFRQVGSELNAMLGARGRQRLRVGIGDDEFNALQPGGDHVVDGVAAGAADADDRQPRFDVDHFRQLQLDAHNALEMDKRSSRTKFRVCSAALFARSGIPSNTSLKPPFEPRSHAAEITLVQHLAPVRRTQFAAAARRHRRQTREGCQLRAR